ncbi:MAG: hypothetical protein WA510_19300 [Acidobacteriaceae bacterium]
MKGLNLSGGAIGFCVAAIVLGGCGGSQQPVGAPATNAVAPAQVLARRPTEAEWERWRSMMLQVPNPGHGCRKAIYPETQWRELRCEKGERITHMPANAGISHMQAYLKPLGIHPQVGGDAYFAVPSGGHITAGLGSFVTVKNIASEGSVGGTDSDYDGANYYSLILATNGFKASGMCPNPNCIGWQEFYFDNQGNTSGNDGRLQIEYWLLNFAPCASRTCTDSCPSGWQGVHRGSSVNPEDCSTWSDETDVQSYAIANGLRYFRLGGASESRPGGSGSDYATLDVYGGPSPQLYQQDGSNEFPALSDFWHTAEFGVYGMCCGSEAFFTGDPTIAVHLGVTTVNNAQTTECPRGIKNGFATIGESNNLKLMPTPLQWPKRNWPAIVFTESNPSKPPKPNCATIAAQ